MNQLGICRKTFAYFEQAQQNENTRAWFDSHKHEYEEHVVVPFTHLILQMRERFAIQLPGVDLSAKKIVKPLRRQAKGLEEPIIRSKTTAFFSEPATSMFSRF